MMMVIDCIDVMMIKGIIVVIESFREAPKIFPISSTSIMSILNDLIFDIIIMEINLKFAQ